MANEEKKVNNGILKDPAFYHTLLDSISDGVFVLNRDWEYILVNQRAADLVKMTIEQLLNKRITNLFPGIEQTKFFRLYEQVMKERKVERIVDEFAHPDGHKGYYEVIVYPVPEGILCISRDITEGKRIEENLLKEKIFTETALNAQQDTFFIFEISTGKALRWNKAFREKSGYSDQEISIMKAPDSYYSEQDLKKAEKTIKFIVNEGTGNIEMSLITKSGRKIPFEYYSSIMKDSEGNPQYILSLGRDITERKQAEDALKENEYYLKTAQEMSHIGHWKLNAITLEVSGSDELFRVFGLSHNEATLDAFAAVVHPDDREYDLYHIQRGMETGESWDIEHRIILKDGTEKWVHAIGEATKDETGKVVSLLGTVQDITERKKAEEVLYHERDLIRTLLENHPDFIYFKDIEGRFQHISKRFCEFFGRTIEEIIGKNDLELFPVDIAQQSYDEDLLIIKTGTPLINKEEFSAGTWVLTTKIPWFDKEGNIKGLFGISHDITERKKVEKEIKESEEKFRTIAEDSHLAITILQDDLVVYTNQKMADMFGYVREEMLTWTPKEYAKTVAEDSLEFVMEQARKKQNGDADVITHYPIHCVKSSGEKFWVDNISTTIIYNGRPADLVTIIDTTDVREAQQKLKESEERYRKISTQYKLLLESITDAVYALNREWKYILVNKNAEKFINMPIDKLMGHRIQEVFPGIETTLFFKTYETVMNTGNAERVTEFFKHPDGQTAYYEVSVYPIQEGILCIAKDVTEEREIEQKLEESEDKFRTITEQSLMGIAILQDNKFRYVNKQISDIFEYTTEEMLNWEKYGFANLIHPDDKEIALEQARKKQLGLQDAVINYQFRGITKNGSIKWLEIYSDSMYYRGETADLITLVDITDRKKAEVELKKSEENYRNAFERAELYKDIFAHDISNLLQNIKSSTDLFSALRNKPEQLEKLDDIMEIIFDQIIRGSNLVSNIRKLSQVSETEIILKKVNLSADLKEAVKFIYESFPYKNLDIKIESKFEDLVVKADTLLLDVFENILFNAVKYTENLTIEILIRISKDLKNETKHLKIEFIDNGIGIADSMKETIFEGNPTHEKRTKGMGLGLLLVKKILDRYNGEIWVEDKIRGDSSKGSNFKVLIPEEVD